MSDHFSIAPAFHVPALACDSHFHVFGPDGAYPYFGKLRYKPPHAPWEDYLEWARHIGLERFVLVQPSAYGSDNRCMLDVMARLGPGICRGVVDLADDTPEAEIAQWHQLGVRGIRINVSPIHPIEAGLCDSMTPRIRRMNDLCRELGWHLDFLLPGWLTHEMLPVMAGLEVPHSVAHMGMFLARQGPQQTGFQDFLALLRAGNTWAKFTGTYRMGTGPDFADVKPMARAIIEAAPKQILWGSDYPHLSFADSVDSTALFNLLLDWAPEAFVRELILRANPAAFFQFD